MSEQDRFQNLTFDGFRDLARDDSLSPHERIGFPDSYRAGKERAILADIRRKVPALDARGQLIVDVGPGCGVLATALIEHARTQGHELVLVDSQEMLDRLPDASFVRKVAARFPAPAVADLAGRAAGVISYSVIQYVFREASLSEFLDGALGLLAPGGALLLGDVPNLSMRKRFFASEAGARFHKAFTRTDTDPTVSWNRLEAGHIDDSVVLSLLLRARLAGFDAYVLPQAEDLPMANRREDLLFRRP